MQWTYRCRSSLFVLAACLMGSSAMGQELTQPGKEHQLLAEMVGKWTTTMKMPDGSEFKGTSAFTAECNGLWICSDFKTDIAGLAFQGRGMDGYDPAKKEFVSIWVDSMSPAPLIFRGSYNDKDKKLTMVAEGPGPDGKPAKWKSVANFENKNRHVFAMYVTPTGADEELMMTVVYERM